MVKANVLTDYFFYNEEKRRGVFRMNQQRTPLFDMLRRYASNKTTFHVPGHKNGTVFPDWATTYFQPLLQIDATEITGLDDLHAPEKAILEAQQLLQAHYQSQASYFLVNGSTVGNLAMILATIQPHDAVLVQRNCHKSILHGLELAGAQPIFIAPTYDAEWQLGTSLTTESVAQAFAHFPQVKALLVTYPTYYGLAQQNIRDIIAIAHAHDAVVLVDEAHGAHFTLPRFPESALRHGADVVIHSAHKTLPAMTMGSYLHIGSGRVSRSRIEYYLQMLQSSSPSYPIMGSLDIARFYLATYIKETPLIDSIETFKHALHALDGIRVLEAPADCELDPLKVTIQSTNHVSGYALQAALEAVGIYPELADPYNVLLILPLAVTDYTEMLQKMACAFSQLKQETLPTVHYTPPHTTMLAKSYAQLHTATTEFVPLIEAIGRISAEMVTPYPPGIPLIMYGERILDAQITAIAQYERFHGGERLQQGLLRVIK